VKSFIRGVQQEYQQLLQIRDMSTKEACQVQGNCMLSFTDSESYGLDMGVQSLCLALNMWPGVFTTCSCSGLHGGALSRDCIVQYVSDNSDSLAKIQSIVEKGALGIKFCVVPHGPPFADRLAPGGEGFATINCNLGKDRPNMCRAWCREIWLPDHPANKLDKALMKDAGNPFARNHANIFGYLALAIELVYSNPSLPIDELDTLYLNDSLQRTSMSRAMILQRELERLGLETSGKKLKF
jgi:hypothetical protein